jgi:hypothetical protein
MFRSIPVRIEDIFRSASSKPRSDSGPSVLVAESLPNGKKGPRGEFSPNNGPWTCPRCYTVCGECGLPRPR